MFADGDETTCIPGSIFRVEAGVSKSSTKDVTSDGTTFNEYDVVHEHTTKKVKETGSSKADSRQTKADSRSLDSSPYSVIPSLIPTP